VMNKISKNEANYPVKESKDSSLKYDRLK
jgi:hypothetical protein